jgi:hypothetical protein
MQRGRHSSSIETHVTLWRLTAISINDAPDLTQCFLFGFISAVFGSGCC